MNRQGKVRLEKWFIFQTLKEKSKIIKEITSLVTRRKPKECNFIGNADVLFFLNN